MKKILLFFFSLFLFANDENVTALDKNNSVTIDNQNVTVLDDDFVASSSNQSPLNIAVVVNREKFSKYIPNLINSINAYLIYKNVDYNLSVYSTDDNLTNFKNSYVIYVDDVKSDLNGSFYYPVIREDDTQNYYGGIDYKSQVDKLNFYVYKKAIAISSNETLSLKILNYEKPKLKRNYFFPKINYRALNHNFVFLNTPVTKSLQILSQITYKFVNPISILSTQINYSPLIISLTQPHDRAKLLIANSIVNVPLFLKDYNRLLNTDIEFNWLNYTTSVLLDKIVSNYLGEDEYYLADFDLYMINHKVVYPVKIYQIRHHNFEEVR